MFSQMVWWLCSLQQEVPLFAMLPWNRSEFQGTIRHQDATIRLDDGVSKKKNRYPMEFPRISWWTHQVPSTTLGFFRGCITLHFSMKRNHPPNPKSPVRAPSAGTRWPSAGPPRWWSSWHRPSETRGSRRRSSDLRDTSGDTAPKKVKKWDEEIGFP